MAYDSRFLAIFDPLHFRCTEPQYLTPRLTSGMLILNQFTSSGRLDHFAVGYIDGEFRRATTSVTQTGLQVGKRGTQTGRSPIFS